VVGCVALLGYASLKAHWALGGTLGVTDVAAWRAALAALTSVERFLAFWGTVLLDAVGAVVLLGLLHRRPRTLGVPRRVWRVLAWLGALVMGVLATTALVVTLGPMLGLWWEDPDAQGPLAVWVFLFVYSCFAVFALALALTAWLTRGASQPRPPVVADT
jgi:hypothetical protein